MCPVSEKTSIKIVLQFYGNIFLQKSQLFFSLCRQEFMRLPFQQRRSLRVCLRQAGICRLSLALEMALLCIHAGKM